MKPAKLSKRAQRDLEHIQGYISADNPEAAERVRKTLLDTADLLADHPEAGHRVVGAGPRHADVRWFVVPGFRNYLIFYRSVDEGIEVFRVLHGARDLDAALKE